MTTTPHESALAHEQAVVDDLYARLDGAREHAQRQLRRAHANPGVPTPGAMVDREAFAVLYAERVAALDAAEERLCFGRLDLAEGTRRYIGRIGLTDDEQRPVLTDWRAPAAEPFYQATALEPQGVTLRRHLVTSGRTVTSIEDDVLDLDALDDPDAVQGGGALMAALGAKRTGRMRDIVATIQGEQDRIIRAPLPGVLVVEGGPGAGKTVVALHRAAYLLFTHRDRIARSGVLVVGPNPLFLRYISQVLPALGETAAVLVTPGQLFPGVDAVEDDEAAVAAVKGDLRMADVVAAAVKARQRVPDAARRLDVDGSTITLTPQMVAAAREKARASRKPHNQARRTFVLSLLDRLAAVLARSRGVDLDSNRELLLADLRDSKDVRREVNLAWMPLSPQQVVADLFADPARLEAAAPRLSARERALLVRERGSAWTVSDVPLLDEAAELLGQDDEAERRAAALAASERAREREYARGVMEMTGAGSMMGAGGVSADQLVERYSSAPVRASVAERAESDRDWVYGHVVVDEAQELSPMAWRVLARRCPTRSMTVVGDLDQTGSAAGLRSWGEVFDRLAPGRWTLERLSINYRTPAPVMALAASVLRASGRDVVPPVSARDGEDPVFVRLASPHDADDLAAAVRGALADPEVGRVAVIAPRADRDWAARALAAALPHGTVGRGLRALDVAVSVLTVTESKGLEFDVVVLLEPAAVLAESTAGARDLYVALSRPTRRVVVLHHDELPPGMPATEA